MKKKAIILGASGATGTSLLFQLLEDKSFSGVLVLTRRELRIQHKRLKQLVLDFDKLSDYSTEITGDVVFCCIGTTKNKTPNEAEYRKIDSRYPAEVARIALANGARSYHLVSAVLADPHSSNTYLRIKGEAEENLKQILFETIHIYRPGLLSTTRKEKRFGEGVMNAVMNVVNPLLMGSLKKFRSNKVDDLAAAMIKLELKDEKGIFIHDSDEIKKLNKVPLPGFG